MLYTAYYILYTISYIYIPYTLYYVLYTTYYILYTMYYILYASLNFLSSAWLVKNPGLLGVSRAVTMYQEAIRDTCPPKDAFKCTKWLRSLEKA